MRCVRCPDGFRAPATQSTPATFEPGVAGASARLEHGRRLAKREARIEARYGPGVIGKLVRAVSTEPQSTQAWAVGAAGEERLARRLAEVTGIRILNDRRVPGTRGNIDHIVVAPAGVFVVDAKNLRGSIQIRDKGSFLRADKRLYVGGRDQSKLALGMTWQVAAVAGALEGSADYATPAVTPVLCFLDAEWPLIARHRVFDGVLLESQRSIAKRFIESNALDDRAIAGIASRLAAALPPKIV
jgi:hypothetical protein